MRKLATAALAALIGVASVAATIAPASAGWKGKPQGQYHNYQYNKYQNNKGKGHNSGWTPGPGVGFAAGALIGLGVGAIVANPGPVYRPAPVYRAPVYYYPPAPTYYVPPPPPPVYRAPVRTWRQAHVDWCLASYRSYNPATDTFMGYDGYAHYCQSPY
jgi:hypothetical protein